MGLFTKKKQAEDQKTTTDKAVDVKVDNDTKVEKEKKSPVKKQTTSVEKRVAVKKVSKKAVGQRNQSRPGDAYRILLKPVISEKATISASQNKYVFEVADKANKVEVKKAILEVYGVVPKAVNILNQGGKTVRFGRRVGKTKNIKKAVVTLKKGDSIKLYEGI
ncbi:50S ribosomal protein L23 [Candidatus Parcubacteria bacterium]|nr:MAG: 50S ribosomal protein L23 [Candidatus Parcubacteria bacterium]